MFNSFPNGKAEDLQQLLGTHVTLALGRDTQQVRVQYNPRTQLNLLTSTETGDTLLLTRVIYHRRLFYFIERAGDSSFAVHAVRIRAHFVQGLNTNWQQMVYLDNAMKGGHYRDLLRSDTVQQPTQLHFNIKALRPFFITVLDSLPRYTLLHPAVASSPHQPSSRPIIPHTTILSGEFTMYPNPAVNHVTLDFATPGQWTVQLYTLDGRVLSKQQLQGTSVTLSLAGISAGNYVVKLTEQNTGISASKRLLVQR